MRTGLLIFSFLITVSCNQKRQEISHPVAIHLKSGNKMLQLNFDSCLSISKSIIRKEFSEGEFEQYFSFNQRATSFNYGSINRSVSDTLNDLPLGYRVFYDFILNKDTLSLFNVDLDSNLHVLYYRYYYLSAFRSFVDKQLSITKGMAKKMAIENGVRSKNIEPLFQCSLDYPDTLRKNDVNYFWEVKSDCDQCVTLKIDAKTGRIFDKGKVVFYY